MKELFFTVLKYYAIIGGIGAGLVMIWMSILLFKANLILARGNIVVIKNGPTFYPESDRMRIYDYFTLARGTGTVILTFALWPYMIYILCTDPKWWCMVVETRRD